MPRYSPEIVADMKYQLLTDDISEVLFMKYCSKCKRYFPRNKKFFYIVRSKRTGKLTIGQKCRDCHKSIMRSYYHDIKKKAK